MYIILFNVMFVIFHLQLTTKQSVNDRLENKERIET